MLCVIYTFIQGKVVVSAKITNGNSYMIEYVTDNTNLPKISARRMSKLTIS